MKPNPRATLPVLLVFRQEISLHAYWSAYVCACMRCALLDSAHSVNVGLQDYLHFLQQMLIASTFCGPPLHLRQDESPSILNTLGCYLHRPGQPPLIRVKTLFLIWRVMATKRTFEGTLK